MKALRQKHPEITTIVQNINGRGTSAVLGKQEQVLYGKGYIEDSLMGLKFRISARSFYQINPVQTEVLYGKALELAGLKGKETVIDALLRHRHHRSSGGEKGRKRHRRGAESRRCAGCHRKRQGKQDHECPLFLRGCRRVHD